MKLLPIDNKHPFPSLLINETNRKTWNKRYCSFGRRISRSWFCFDWLCSGHRCRDRYWGR